MTPSISRHLGILTALSLLLWAAAPPVAAQAADYTYETNNGRITITGYTGPGGAVTIPDTINGLPVTSIGQWAFSGTSLTSVTIGNSVTSIGESAFSGCTSLTSVTIGNSVTTIGGGAFRETSLTNVTIPDSVTSIGWAAFSDCTSLTSVTIPDRLLNAGLNLQDLGQPVATSGLLAIKVNGSMVITGYNCSNNVVTIPDTINGLPVTGIDGAFGYCTSLTNVTIPESVTRIGGYAFYYCTSLTSITIPNSVTYIGGSAFYGCSSLTSITIPDSLLNVGLDLGDLGQPVATSGWRAIKVNESMAITGYHCSSDVVAIPDTINGLPVTGIDGAFSGCTGLTSITIPNSVTRIGWYAFSGCTGLTNVTIPDSVTSIGSGAFYGCTSLTSVTIPHSVTHIGHEAFRWCTSLTSVTIGNSVTTIGGLAFSWCTSLSAITIPDSVTSIGDWAFGYCTSLISITLPNGLTSIPNGAFEGCASLTSITIPDSVTSIGGVRGGIFFSGAFSGCSSLTRITIPNSVTTIGWDAFFGCTNLTAAYFQGNAPSLDGGDPVFDGATHAIVFYLAGTTGWGSTFGGLPTALWSLPSPVVLNHGTRFGPQTNSFGFTISWATNLSVVVEASPSLADPVWSPVATNTLTGGSSYFSDPQWTNYPSRFYRIRSP